MRSRWRYHSPQCVRCQVRKVAHDTPAAVHVRQLRGVECRQFAAPAPWWLLAVNRAFRILKGEAK